MGRFKSVLVVEDEPEIQENLRLILENEGYQVVLAQDGRVALDVLRSGKLESPCLILLDLMMPEMSGWEFLKIRRYGDIIASIPVVVLSVRRHPEGRDESDDASRILKKPIDLTPLIAQLERFCGK